MPEAPASDRELRAGENDPPSSVDILLVEDADVDARAVTATLRSGETLSASVERTDSLTGAVARLRSGDPDVVLLDLHLPDSRGLETVAAVVDAEPAIPVIVLTSRDDRRTARRSLRRGAQDYIVKSRLDPGRLERAIQYGRERKRTENRAKERERYRNLFRTWPDGAVIVDRDGRIVEANDRAGEIFGYETDDLEGQELEVLLPEGLRECHRRHRARYAENPTSRPMGRNLELEGRRADGSRVPLEIGLSPIEAGDERRFVATVRDLSPRRRMEQKLRESRRELQRAQRIAQVGNWSWDVDTGELTWSDEIYRIFGHEPGTFTPTYERFLECVHPDDRDRVEERVNRALDGEEPYDVTHRLVRPDGEVRWVRERGEVSRDPAGRPRKMFGVVHDETEHRRMRRRLEWRATHDALTGLPNRRLFRRRASEALATARGRDCSAAAVFVDLDRFKALNESLGHRTGDRVLELVAGRLEDAIRHDDTAARIGGDEFALILVDCEDGTRARRVVRRMAQLFQDPFRLDETEVHLDASIGLAVADVGEVSEAGELLRRADAAMYRAKEGRGTEYAAYDPEVDVLHAVRLQREQELRRAIEAEEFVLRYQPVHDLLSGETIAVEALARWRREDGNLRPPSEFIPLAEDSGLIVPLGRLLLRTACREIGRLQEHRDGMRVPVLVNVSASQFEAPDFVETVETVLDECPLEAQDVHLEVTEGVLMETADQLETLSSLGVGVLVDDFGTGYSSLRYLKSLDVTHLKLDRSFVRNLPSGAEDEAIVSMILDLAEALGLGVVAEGVETEAQLRHLRRLGCRVGQGFHLSRPRAVDALVEGT